MNSHPPAPLSERILHTPVLRRSLSGRLVPLPKPTDWLKDPGYEPTPSRNTVRAAFDRLSEEEMVDHLNGTLKPAVLADLITDELTRQPLNTRAKKRDLAKVMSKKAKRGRVRAAKSTIALRLATPAPSRGFLRLLLANANRAHDEMVRHATIGRHPAGKAMAA